MRRRRRRRRRASSLMTCPWAYHRGFDLLSLEFPWMDDNDNGGLTESNQQGVGKGTRSSGNLRARVPYFQNDELKQSKI